tara:strand:- start:680 stop:1375 length:696 start_codon:yes stop_codon:yes gene_type:complete
VVNAIAVVETTTSNNSLVTATSESSSPLPQFSADQPDLIDSASATASEPSVTTDVGASEGLASTPTLPASLSGEGLDVNLSLQDSFQVSSPSQSQAKPVTSVSARSNATLDPQSSRSSESQSETPKTGPSEEADRTGSDQQTGEDSELKTSESEVVGTKQSSSPVVAVKKVDAQTALQSTSRRDAAAAQQTIQSLNLSESSYRRPLSKAEIVDRLQIIRRQVQQGQAGGGS